MSGPTTDVPSLSLVIPVYNAADQLPATLQAVDNFAATYPASLEILFVVVPLVAYALRTPPSAPAPRPPAGCPRAVNHRVRRLKPMDSLIHSLRDITIRRISVSEMDNNVYLLTAKASGPVNLPIKDFYLTNAICRASPTMRRCSEELLHGVTFAEAAE